MPWSRGRRRREMRRVYGSRGLSSRMQCVGDGTFEAGRVGAAFPEIDETPMGVEEQSRGQRAAPGAVHAVDERHVGLVLVVARVAGAVRIEEAAGRGQLN